MDNNLCIYKCFFHEQKYIQLGFRKRYLLALMYIFSDKNDHVVLLQKDLSKLMNKSKQNINSAIKELATEGFVEVKRNKYIKVNRPANRESIPMSKELVDGKYQYLSKGAKFFYIYFSHLQKKENEEYILMKGVDIIKIMGVDIKVMQKYYNELEEVGLLKKGKQGVSNTFDFKKIT